MKLKDTKLQPMVSDTPDIDDSSGIITRIKNSFFAADMNNIGEYLLENVIFPSCKDLASNVVDSVFGNIITMKDILIYGEARGKAKQTKHTDYSGVFRKSNEARHTTIISSSSKPVSINYGGRYDFSARTFDYLDDAKSVLLELCDILEEYDAVTVANFCDLANLPTKPVDYKWGWTNLSSAKVKPTGSKWYIDMPKPIYLE